MVDDSGRSCGRADVYVVINHLLVFSIVSVPSNGRLGAPNSFEPSMMFSRTSGIRHEAVGQRIARPPRCHLRHLTFLTAHVHLGESWLLVCK